MPDLYYLYFKCINLVSVVRLNDVPLIADADAEGIVITEPINYWVTHRSNNVQIDLDWPESQEFESGQSKMEMMVFRADPGSEMPKPGDIILNHEWPGEGATDEAGMYPYSYSEQFSIIDPPDTKLWQEAEPIDSLTQNDKEAILRKIERLRSTLLNREKEKAFSILSYRYADEALAEGKKLDQIRSAVMELYDWMFNQGDLSADPLTIENSRFNIVGNRKLVYVDRGNLEISLVLTQEAEGVCFGIPIYAAKIKGKWLIVR